MTRKRSVRQLLQTLLVVNTLAVLLVGIIGALAVYETTRTVDTLSQELSPAQQANARFADRGTDRRPAALRPLPQRLAAARESVAHLDAGSGSRIS